MKSAVIFFAILPVAFASPATSKPKTIPCGSRGLPPCGKGQTCVANPATPNCDPRVDCPGICVTPDGPFCGGIGAIRCPKAGQICVDNPFDSCEPFDGGRDCGGICVFPDGSPSKPTVSSRAPAPTGAPCGGFLGTPCHGVNEICVDVPNDDCDPKHGGADCPGECVQNPHPTGPQCGGFAGIKCPSLDLVCIDHPSDDCDPKKGGADCIGVCVPRPKPSPSDELKRRPPTFASCGGFTGKPCPRANQKCVDDPRDSCDPKKGGADCPGICIGATCGGFAGLQCPTGQTCVDDPRDSCDPKKGGADCGGVCI